MRTSQTLEVPRNADDKCPLCHHNHFACDGSDADCLLLRCRNCGVFRMERALSEHLRSPDLDDDDQILARYVGCHTRQSYSGGCQPVVVTKDNWRSVAIKHKASTPERRIFLLLELLMKRAGRHGRSVEFNFLDESNGFLVDEPFLDSFVNLANELVRIGFIDYWPCDAPYDGYMVTYQGYRHLQDQTSNTHRNGEGEAASSTPASTKAEDILARLREWKRTTGYSLEAIAMGSGVSKDQLSRLLSGDRDLSPKNRVKIENYLNSESNRAM